MKDEPKQKLESSKLRYFHTPMEKLVKLELISDLVSETVDLSSELLSLLANELLAMIILSVFLCLIDTGLNTSAHGRNDGGSVLDEPLKTIGNTNEHVEVATSKPFVDCGFTRLKEWFEDLVVERGRETQSGVL